MLLIIEEKPLQNWVRIGLHLAIEFFQLKILKQVILYKQIPFDM